MLLFFVLFFLLLVVMLSGITTIPLAIALLVAATVVFKKSWVFFAALGVGLLLDLVNLRPLGYTSLIFTIFVFVIWLYERKFETQTITFVFFAAFLESTFYLWLFRYQMVFLQSFTTALLSALFFRVILSKAKDLDSSLRSE